MDHALRCDTQEGEFDMLESTETVELTSRTWGFKLQKEEDFYQQNMGV